MPIAGTSTAFSTKPYGGLGDDPPVGFLFTDIVSTNLSQYNLRDRALNFGWDGISALDARIIINENVILGSGDTTIASFSSDLMPTNSRLILRNLGYIIGAGGAGGNAPSGSGGNAGTALNLELNSVIDNQGIIAGGGGGGGAGGNAGIDVGGSGGGGGAGAVAGAGGTGSSGTVLNGNGGNTGGQLTGGAGGAGTGINPLQTMTFGVGSHMFQVPSNVFMISVRAAGGGGGGAGGMLAGCGNVNHAGGGGGGGGALFDGMISVTPNEILSLSVGAGGLGGFARDNRFSFSGDGPTVGLDGNQTTIVNQGLTVNISLNGGSGGRIQEGNGNCGTNTTVGGAGGTGGASGANIIAGYSLLSGGRGGNGGSNGSSGLNGASVTGFGTGGTGGQGSGGAQSGAGGGGGGASLGSGGRGGRYQSGTVTGTIGPMAGTQGAGGGGGGGEGSGYARIDGSGGDGIVEFNFREATTQPVVASIQVVGGGAGGSGTNGAGDIWGGGAGGSGGFVNVTNQQLDAYVTYQMTVGAGGAAGRVTFNGVVLCNEPSTQGGNGAQSRFIGGLVSLTAGGGFAGTPAPNGDNGPGTGGAGGTPNGVAGGQQRPIQRNNFAPALGGVNSTGIGSGGNGNGGGPNVCPTAGGNGQVTVSYTSPTQLFIGGTITNNAGIYTHTFSTAGNFELVGQGGVYGGFGGAGGDAGRSGERGGTSSTAITGGAGGLAGNAISHTGYTLTLSGNTPIGAIIG